MEDLNKLADAVKKLQDAVNRALKTTTTGDLSRVDAEIGAHVHSIYYGAGATAISVKRVIDEHRRKIRMGVVTKPVEKPAKKKPAEKKPAAKKAKKTTKKK